MVSALLIIETSKNILFFVCQRWRKQAMMRVKRVLSTNNYRQQQPQLGWSGTRKAAKMTMTAVDKNQAVNNDRWQNVLHSYHDFLIRH